ncbi:MAG: YcxB family protein [Bacteroidota bacterium]
MVVRTQKYKLQPGTYIRSGLENVIREQWWVFLIALGIMSGTFFIKTLWFVIGATVALALYFLFWVIQFYGITQREENRLIFEPLTYEITSRQIIAQVSAKQGIPIAWDQIKRARRGKNYFLLSVSKAHLIYLPHNIFSSLHETKFVEILLRRKGLLK